MAGTTAFCRASAICSARVYTGAITQSHHNLFLLAAFTSVPARFEGARFSSVPGSSTVSVSGNRLPYAPERLMTAAAGYAHPAP